MLLFISIIFIKSALKILQINAATNLVAILRFYFVTGHEKAREQICKFVHYDYTDFCFVLSFIKLRYLLLDTYVTIPSSELFLTLCGKCRNNTACTFFVFHQKRLQIFLIQHFT